MPQIVLYDACVIYPAPLRDLLMWVAKNGLVYARWSDQILEEWIRSLLENRKDLSRERLERTRTHMNIAIPDALVMGFEHFISSLDLPDVDDRHVLAVAIASEAEIILTLNLTDFPKDRLPKGILAMAPDPFLCHLFEIHAEALLATMKEHRANLFNPPKSPEEYLGTLRAVGLAELASHVEMLMDQI